MIFKVKKKVLFLLGIFITGFAGVISGYFKGDDLKDDSLLTPTAHADAGSWAWSTSGGGDSGGCSGDTGG